MIERSPQGWLGRCQQLLVPAGAMGAWPKAKIPRRGQPKACLEEASA